MGSALIRSIGFLEGADDIRVGRLVEADVAVADLDEIEFRRRERARIGQRIAQAPAR